MPLILLLLIPLVVQAKPSPIRVPQNGTNGGPSSLWLKRVTNPDPRGPGCWNRPWTCRQGEYPPRIRMLCCQNRCVDVTSDVNNCGLCGIRCPFTWQCCRRFCINTNINPFHCGRCDHRCPFGSFCFYGMCGYAAPPFPWPLPPRPPFPFPPHPPFPFPPHPPHGPFPPKPPHGPFPPHGPHSPPAQTAEGGHSTLSS
ncbi:hypothetical protein Acr_17g0005210 [Actinidia rufa]|uniref:Stigma-specific Stig1 family protein n=1 Tax=Actinidia rufa TaxID=165716 RepID=A0A7J0G2F3_9ERIC|nr:hypothetical protein Acr_17g0005210 [Actinidia rufa]